MRLSGALARSAALGGLLLVCGCPISAPPCSGNEGIGDGQRVRVTFVARYLPDGEYVYQDNFLSNRRQGLRGCDGLDGVGPGTIMEMQVVDNFFDEACSGKGMKVYVGPPMLALGEYEKPLNVPTGLAANHRASIGGCEWNWTLWFQRTSTDVNHLAPRPVPGQLPPVVAARDILRRDIHNTPASCQPCQDKFVVYLEKIP